MNILALNTTEGFGIYGGKLVYSAAETQALFSCIDTAEHVQQIKSSTEATLKQDRVEARQQGFDQGLQEGRDQAKQEIAEALMVQQNELHHAQQALRDQSIAIALEIVKKIAGNVAPEQLVMSLAQTAAKELAPEAVVTLRTHSDNVAKLVQLISETNQTQFIEVVGDASLAIDSCVLETQLGSIEADLQTQLAAIKQHLGRG